MKTIPQLLDEKLIGNDINLVDTILGYLMKCDCCDKYDDCKIFYIKICPCYDKYNSCGRCPINDYNIRKMCYSCLKRIMLNHNQGKNGVLTIQELQDKKLN